MEKGGWQIRFLSHPIIYLGCVVGFIFGYTEVDCPPPVVLRIHWVGLLNWIELPLVHVALIPAAYHIVVTRSA